MLPWKVKDIPHWFTSLPGIDSHPRHRAGAGAGSQSLAPDPLHTSLSVVTKQSARHSSGRSPRRRPVRKGTD